MSDNIRATPSTGSTGALFASDELIDPLGGSTALVQVPLSKLIYGAADSGTLVSTNAGLPVFITGSTALSVSGSTVSVSGSSVTLNGVSSNAGLPVFIYGSTALSVSGSTVSVSGSSVTLNGVSSNAGLPVFIYGSTVISVSGSSVTLNGVSSDSGLPVRIMGSTTIIVSGSTVSVSGSTVSVSGSTLSVINGSTFLVQPQAYASGGASPYSFLSTTTVQAAAIKASAGQVYNLAFFSTDTGTNYVRLYDQAASPASTDDATIKWRGTIPGNSDGSGFVTSFPLGLTFASGIGIRVSAGSADTDATVLAANEIRGNVGYK